jgi:gliding motility-associated-like protein
VLEPLDLNVSIDSICSSEASTITINTSRPVASISIDPDNIIASRDSNVITTIPLEETQQLTVTVLDTFGCEDTAIDLELFVSPVFTGQSDTFFILRGGEVELPAFNPGLLEFSWSSSGDTSICPSCSLPVVSPNETTAYTLTVSGCTNTTVVYLVNVVEEPVVPNLFTPNNDGTNDDWGPLFPEGFIPEVEVYQVYNRWGALVFESDDPIEKWVGDVNGSGEAPSDVYAYIVQFRYPDGASFYSAGEVTLLR